MITTGTPLTQAVMSLLGISGDPFWANYQRWRNPGGFVCDVNKREHYGVIYDVTANQRGTAGYVEGATLFPSYKQNLFALLLMIAFVPQQHGVTFIVNTDRMVITKVFQYTKFIFKKTCEHACYLNKIYFILVYFFICFCFVNRLSSL